MPRRRDRTAAALFPAPITSSSAGAGPCVEPDRETIQKGYPRGRHLSTSGQPARRARRDPGAASLGTRISPAVPRHGLTSALPAVLILPVAARIEVSPESEHEFRVTVTDAAARTVHRVTVPAPYYEKLTGRRITAKALVRLSFEFLLEREPKESILQAFDLPVIGRYFPEFEREMRRRLDAS